MGGRMRSFAFLAVCVLLMLGLFALPLRAEEEKPAETPTDVEEASVVPPDEEEGASKDALSETEVAALKKSSESHDFQAEVSRLLDIIINSLYTQKEIFLRELISNAADAIEKIRYASIADPSVLEKKKQLDIRIEVDKEAKTLSLTDSGVGMTKADLINNLGTVAKSGTTNFLEAIGGADVSLIGQFGVGFYSSFLVADRVTVTSKHNDDEQTIWESTADASFSIAKDPRGDTLGRGTRVTLHLKEDASEFLNEQKLQELCKKFSQFISFPIYLKTVKEEEVEEEVETEKTDDDEVTDGEEKEKKKVTKKIGHWEQMNTQKALWLRSKEDITEADYNSFYKSLSRDFQEPLAYTHFSAEGEVEFKSILFIPDKAPYDMFDNYFGKQSMLKLYVRRVLVADAFDDLMPRYLHFVRGVVDSDDMPLNVAREQLQQHKIMKKISQKLVRKTLELIKNLAKDHDKEMEKRKEEAEEATGEGEEKKKKDETKTKFEKFQAEFNKNLKLGCYEDDANRSKIAKVLRFLTSKSKEVGKPLSEYIEGMAPEQEAIYYASGPSVESLMDSPLLKAFKKRDIEVLLLTEAMDESCVQKMVDFEGKKFTSVQKGDVNLDDSATEKKRVKKLKDMFKPLLTWMKDNLGDKVSKVEISTRLEDDPCAIVSSQWGYSAQMERIMKAQAFANKMDTSSMGSQKIMEINPSHPLMQKLLEELSDDPVLETRKPTLTLLFQSAMLASGYDIESPNVLASKLYRSLAADAGVDPDAELKEVDVGSLEEEEDTYVGDTEPIELGEDEEFPDEPAESVAEDTTEGGDAAPADDVKEDL